MTNSNLDDGENDWKQLFPSGLKIKQLDGKWESQELDDLSGEMGMCKVKPQPDQCYIG